MKIVACCKPEHHVQAGKQFAVTLLFAPFDSSHRDSALQITSRTFRPHIKVAAEHPWIKIVRLVWLCVYHWIVMVRGHVRVMPSHLQSLTKTLQDALGLVSRQALLHLRKKCELSIIRKLVLSGLESGSNHPLHKACPKPCSLCIVSTASIARAKP